jgi:RNA polymerase sigma-70 factor (ECF subfamily)
VLNRDPLANPEALLRRVYGYVAYRVGKGADAEDITSATFERALRYRETFDASRGEPLDWLLGIARRAIAEHFRRPEPVGEEVAEVPGPADLETDSATRLDLAAAVGRLDERARELVALRYGADLTARQIGEMLGLKTTTVEVALHRAIRQLRVELEDEPQMDEGSLPASHSEEPRLDDRTHVM